MAASEKDVRLFLESRRMARQLGQSSPDLFPTRAAQNEAAAKRAAALKEGYESLPAPVRYGVSAARGIVDAATLGYGDEIRGRILRAAGRPTAATVDEMMEHADRGIGEKIVGGVSYLAGTLPVAMATGAATTAGMAAAAPRLAGRAPGLARALTYLTQAAPSPASAGRVAAREALRGGGTRAAAAAAGRQAGRSALAQGAAQNVVQGLGFSALTEPVRDLPEGTSRAESVALNTGVGAVADALLYPVFGRFAPAATTPPRAGRRAINAIPFRYTTTPQSSAVHGSLRVPEPAPRGIETYGAPTQVEAALRRANEVSAAARLAEDEAAIQASLAQRQRMGEAPATPRVLGPQGTPARAEPPTPRIEIAPAPIRGRPIEPRRGRFAPDEPSPRFTGATLEPGSAADVAMRRARALAEPVPEPDVDVPLRSAAEIGQRRAVEMTQPDRAAREAPARSLLVPEPGPREITLLDAQGRPLRRPVEAPEPETVPEMGTTPEPVAVEEPTVLDLSAVRQRRARTEPAPESSVAPAESPMGERSLRDEAAEELASLPPKARTIVENALGAETEQALFAEMSNLQGVRMTDQQAEIVNGLFARARERLAPKADAAPVAAATETPTASTLEAGGRRASGRATEVDSQTLLADMRALQRALPTAEADPNIRVIEVSGDAAALREAVQQAGAPERIFRIGDNEYVVLAPAEQADAVLAAARERGLAGGVGTTLDEANTAMRRGMMEFRPSAPASGALSPDLERVARFQYLARSQHGRFTPEMDALAPAEKEAVLRRIAEIEAEPRGASTTNLSDMGDGFESAGRLRPPESPMGDRTPDLSQTRVVDAEGRPLRVYHGSTSTIEGDMRPGTAAHSEGIFFTDSPDVASSVYARGEGAPNEDGIRAALRALPEQRVQQIIDDLRARNHWFTEFDQYEWDDDAADALTNYAIDRFDRMEGAGQAVDALAEAIGVPARVPEAGANVTAAYLDMRNPLEIDAGGDAFDAAQQARWIRQAKEQGHDGLIIRNYHDGGTPDDTVPGGFRSAGAHTVYVAFDPKQVRAGHVQPRAPEAQAVERGMSRAEPGGWQQAERDRIAAGTKRVGDTASERAPSQAPTELAAVDDFTASMTPMARVRAESALATSMNHNGTVRTRREIVETMVGDGATVVPHPKDGRRLMRPDGSYIEERRLTKTAMDYAEHLLARRATADAPVARAAEPLQSYRDELAAARTADEMEAVRVRALGDTSIPHDQMVAFNREAVEAIEAKKADVSKKIDDFFSGRSQQRAEPLPETRRPDAAVEQRPRAASIDGQETTVRNLAGKGETRVRYRAVESSNLQASHNASTFQKNPAYPEGVQPRQYERDKNLQESVARLQQEFDPRVVTSNTALATEGPPISTPDGITLSGNSRLMAMQRIYAQGGEQAAQLRQAMIDAGEQFGIPRAELEQMRQPIIDRELIDESLDLTQRDVLRSVADRANVTTTKADSPIADAATRAQRLTPSSRALRHMEQTIGPEQTPRDYLGTREGRQFVDELVNEGVISRDELSRFVDSQGVLTSDGRDLVERTLLAAAIDDRDILARATENLASTVQGLTRAAPAILRARAVEGWNVQGALNEGLDIALEAKAKGMTIRDLLDQGSMFDDAQRSAHGAMMARFLDGSTQTEVKDAFRMYAREAEIARKMGETGDLFGAEPKSPAQAFDEIFGAPERMAKSKRKPCR